MNDPKVTEYMKKILDECNAASAKFRPFASKHEGWAILQEEVDELWEAVKNDSHYTYLEEEAVQVAAMALRFLVDVVERKKNENS